MGKFMVGLTRILLLCAVVLVFPGLAAYANQTITYSGPFTNTTFDVHGNVIIDLNIGTDNALSGYINFTESPGEGTLCGAGDLTGIKQENSIEFSFTSRDPDPGCGFDWGAHFTVTGTLSEGEQIFEGNYFIDNGQQGIFRVTSTATPVLSDPGDFIAQPVYPTEIPQGQAPNLIVIVHGCCTDENDLTGWEGIRSSIKTRIEQSQPSEAWEIVVWDWTDVTKSKTPSIAYDGAPPHGQDLGKEIVKWPYHYVHFIAHSAGSRLIHEAAKYIKTKDDTPPFIHSSFLDAYCPLLDQMIYADHSDYAEQYVDRGLLLTDADLANAYNFNITDLPKYPLGTRFPNGWPNEWYLDYHFWPVEWYQQSIQTAAVYGFGFPLSFEANGDSELSSYYSELKNTLLLIRPLITKARAILW
jgi:hypothetical protein